MGSRHDGNVDRRQFLGLGAGFAASALLASGRSRATAGTTPVGIQLYTLQGLLFKDFENSLIELARIGYREVESVGLLGHEPAAFRAALDKAGLTVPSSHVLSARAQALMLDMASGRLPSQEAWGQIDVAMAIERIEATMADMFVQSAVLGNKYLVLAAIDANLLQSRAGIDRIVAAFTKAGDLCHERGLRFGFHPHLAEFQLVEGERAVDRILKATDPDRVVVELDFFWAAAAGVDIPRWLARHHGRVHLGHIKDMTKGVVVPSGGFRELNALPGDPFEDVGFGELDYRSWIPLARQAGMRHFFVERDNAPRPLENARRSIGKLQALLG